MSTKVLLTGAAVAVVLASAGYPESSSTGDVITGVGSADALPDVHVIHAGTALAGDDLVTRLAIQRAASEVLLDHPGVKLVAPALRLGQPRHGRDG